MRRFAVFFERTAIGGLLFLLPLALLVFLVGQIIVILQPIAVKASVFISGLAIGPFWLALITVLILVFLAFLAGLAAQTLIGRNLIEGLETFVLNQVPGYSLMKSTAADAASSMAAIDESDRKRAVLVAGDEFWQIGFVTDERDGEVLAVFVPGSPSPDSGSLLYVPRARIIESGMSSSDALACLRRLGVRTPPLSFPGLPIISARPTDSDG